MNTEERLNQTPFSVSRNKSSEIKYELMTQGPVLASCRVFGDFLYGSVQHQWSDTNGIYINEGETGSNSLVQQTILPPVFSGIKAGKIYFGNIHVAIVGWGEEFVESLNKSVAYWIVRCPFGSSWNAGGTYKHAMYPYNKECGLDVHFTTTEGKATYSGSIGFQVNRSITTSNSTQPNRKGKILKIIVGTIVALFIGSIVLQKLTFKQYQKNRTF